MNWKRGPPVLVGEKVSWTKNPLNKPKTGVVKWIGNIPEISADWCIGIELDEELPNLGGDGFWKERKLFECRLKHGVLVPIESVKKIDLKNQNRPEYTHAASETYSSNFEEKHKYTIRAFGGKVQRAEKNAQEVNKHAKGESPIKFLEEFKTDLYGKSNSNKVKDSEAFDSKTNLNDFLKNMNEISGYFKEIKEGDERLGEQENINNIVLCRANETTHSKPKKLFSFLKWFNKKNKNERNFSYFQESSAASSPIFPRKETSSCESIDTIFSTQTVRSFAYIPPTLYRPSAPPLDYDKSSYENVFDEGNETENATEDTESIYGRRKKRKAPKPPRLSRENSLPTTLEHKKSDGENFDEIKTCHRRTVSESFKDKKAGAYCHVQGKRKAPPPPVTPLYPNLQKVNPSYLSLSKKKRPAPPPPEGNLNVQNPTSKFKTQSPAKEQRDESIKDNKKETKINQTPQDRLSNDASLSPLPSRPWYKRSHRDSTGSNIIRKDLLKGFDKKKNKETDDWMPEVGFPRRSLSTESSQNKFNIFSKLEKTEEKKKEEKRKSQISILTNISELDREAAEIVRKEQAEEKKMLAANDAKYYSEKENIKISECTPIPDNLRKNYTGKNKLENGKDLKIGNEFNRSTNVNTQNEITEKVKAKPTLATSDENKFKNNDSKTNQSNEIEDNSKQNFLHSDVQSNLAHAAEKSPENPLGTVSKASETSARLNYFNVKTKELKYLNEPWVCPKCTLENPGWRVFCEICSSVKPRFNNAAQKIPNTGIEEFADKNLSNLKVDVSKETSLDAPPTTKKETEETIEELRKKRMNFFSTKSDTSPEPNQSKNECVTTNLNKVKENVKSSLKEQIAKDAETITKDDTNNKKSKLLNSDSKEVEVKESFEKREERKEAIEELKEDKEGKVNQKDLEKPISGSPETSLVQGNQTNDKLREKGSDTQVPKEEIAEAYIITKTIVLEDIIVKKPERGKKVSTSVQTKSTIPTSPDIHPPPRTKKVAFEPTNETDKEISRKSVNSTTYEQDDLEELTSKLTKAEGLADFRANIATMPLNTEMNTVAVNRLLRKLEAAINSGDHFVAAGLAKELALMKINCSVTRQVTPSPSTSKITLDLYIEDKISHQGPIQLKISPNMTLLQLKQKVHQELGVPLEVQRWILGKKLATDDSKTLEAEGVVRENCPVFLYLVAPDNRKPNKESIAKPKKSLEPPKPEPAKYQAEGFKPNGWYYNCEEDHYSYCEDSSDDSQSTNKDLNEKTRKTTPEKENTPKDENSRLIKKETNLQIQKKEKPSFFDLRNRDSENDIEKELKFIPGNSVKQKVEQLNKSFAESAKAIQAPSRISRSLETWKCESCNVINLPGRLNCLSCNKKRIIYGANVKKPNTKEISKKENVTALSDSNIHYKTLVELQDADLVPNSEPFNCSICLVDYAPGDGVTLKDCLHTFCRSCLIGTVQYSEDAEVKCPYFDNTYSCPSVIQQREIKALVPQKIFELHLAKSVKEAENKIENAFHCKTPDCRGWCIYEDNVNEFRCPVCRTTNCLTCQAIHVGINCREYQERMKDASDTDVDAKKTRDMLNEMVEKGEAMACPKCQVVLMKKWGCDWLRCSMCKTEICWVTRGFRWGPEGKGDTSGGCKCGVNGIKCHPKCNYCH